MKRLCLFALVMCAGRLYAATCPISAGASTASIISTLNACGSGNTATFAAGNYSITSQITIPNGVSLTGPAQDTTIWPITPTAILTNSGMVNTPGFRTTAGSAATTIQFLQYNGANPSSGGGFIYVTPGTNNLTVQYNWAYGVSAQQTASNIADTLIWMDGSDVAGSPHTQNTTIRMNRLGTPNSNDCAALMNVIGGPYKSTSPFGVCTQSGSLTYTPPGGSTVPAGYNGGGTAMCLYQDGDVEKSSGGYCAGVGVHVMTDNLTISNNSFAHLEQGIKYFEGCGSQTCPNQFFTTNQIANANDFTQTHRITIETQQTLRGAPFQLTNISMHDEILFGGVSWGISAPQSSLTSDPQVATLINNNLLIDNSSHGTDKNGYGAARSYGVEFWGYGAQSFNNLIQGIWGGSYAWGFGGSNGGTFWNISNNTMQQLTTLFEGYITNEEGATNPPTQAGNVTTHTVAAVTSVAPTISPSSGSAPLTVTLTDPGYTSGSLPQGNTGIWYTTDGTNPVPGSGSAKYLSSGGTFTLASSGTVKAVGMWGALNQPTSYASGYGFVPSGVVTANFGGGLFISPTGNDANPGTLASPWLTPNHSLTCGQTITAVSGTYSASNFGSGKWGTVSCPGSNDVAWLTCQTFDTCKITATAADGIRVDKSFWGVQGWEVTSTTSQNGGCFVATTDTSGVTQHHIIFANNVANGCQGGGFTTYNNGSAGVDYVAIVGNAAWNASRGNTHCFSGISIYTPVASDTVAGTHLYVAGNFSYDNLEPNPCNGTTPTDGEGVIIDTLDGSQGGPQYNQQVVVQNNIVFNNGGMGTEVINNQLQSTPAKVWFRNNTAVGDATDNNQTGGCLGRSDVSIKLTKNTTLTNNLAQTKSGTSCMSGAIYGSFAETVDASSTASVNWFYSALGHSTFVDNGGSFAYTSTTTTNPTLASVADPGAPACSGKTNVPACMSTLIANLAPSASGSSAYGYQTPSNVSITDSLFPAWLCSGTALNPNIPSGLITPGCGGGTSPTLVSGSQTNAGSINTLAVGAPGIQQIAVGSYSSGAPRNLPDPYGNTANWSSTDPATLNVTTSGVVSCLKSGTATTNVVSSPTSIHFSSWDWTCTAATPHAPTGVSVIVIQ